MRRGCRVGMVAGGALLAAALVPSTAGAVTPVVTNDAGAPVVVTPGLVIRNMSANVGYVLGPGEGRVIAGVSGPDGQPAATPRDCMSFVTGGGVDYRGNGTYTITVLAYGPNDFNCATPIGLSQTAFTISASVGLGQVPGRQLIRTAGSFSRRDINVPISLNPGALGHEIRYKRNGRVGPDGALVGPSNEAFADSARAVVPLRLDKPGHWVIVARAKGFSNSGGQYFTPWSAPVTIRAVAPFDILSMSFPDSRGPSYMVRGLLRESSARGVVQVLIAPGRRGGKFRPLGRARVGKKATFSKRFTVQAPGVYRLRFVRKKNATMNGGVITRPITISRRFF